MVPNKLLEYVRTHTRPGIYKKGSIIIHQGDALDYVYLIDEGLVSLFDTDKFGNARIAAVYPTDQIFPVSWLLQEPLHTGARFSYEALTDVSCRRISRAKVHEFLINNFELYPELVDMLNKGLLNAFGRIYNLQKSNVGEKIDYILNFLAKAYGEQRQDGKIEIDPAFTRQKIADFAGISREEVTRQLTKPKYKSIFMKENKKLVIDLKELNTDKLPVVFRIKRET